MAKRKSDDGATGEIAVVGELVEYRPGQWVRASSVVSVERLEPAPAGTSGSGFGDFGHEPTRLLVASGAVTGSGASADWWRSPHPIDAMLDALAEALENTRAGSTAPARAARAE
jgi:hypothetical protein